MSPDIAASVRARLLVRARQTRDEFELYLVRFAAERFLYRLGASPLRDRYVLKGAALLMLWMEDPYRRTRDIDLLAHGASDEGAIREFIASICSMPCPEDGLKFDIGSIEISAIREGEEYQGKRAMFWAHLGVARIRLQVDIGFGDAVFPVPSDAEYPTLLPNLPAPRVRAYRRETSIAEKFEAMVTLGRRNSRMKDFHDLWALPSSFTFEGLELRQALVSCFERRRTDWTSERPDVLGSGFYLDAELRGRWAAYLRSGAFIAPPPADFEIVGERLRAFLGPLQESVVAAEPFDRHWTPGGPWR